MHNNGLSWVGNVITIVCASLVSTEVAQLILYILGILGALFSLFINIYTWYKKTKADGKITKDEVKDLSDTINDGVKDIIDKTKGDK